MGKSYTYLQYTGRQLNVHKIFKRHAERLMYSTDALCTVVNMKDLETASLRIEK